MHQHRTDPTAALAPSISDLQAPAIVVARGTPPARSLCEPEHAILPPGVRWVPTPPARSVTGTRGVARIPVRRRQLWPVLFCRLIVAWSRGLVVARWNWQVARIGDSGPWVMGMRCEGRSPVGLRQHVQPLQASTLSRPVARRPKLSTKIC